MRYAQFGYWPEWIDYRNIRHAHSHLALLGWLYAGLFTLIVVFYDLGRPIYSKVFWAGQFCVLGMLVGFFVGGYNVITIVFLSLFIFLNYIFVYLVYSDLKKQKADYSIQFLKTALFFLFLSSFGTWGLAAMMTSSMKGSAEYYGAIQFYLHFQFNGWLIFGVLAIFFRLLTLKNININEAKLTRFYRLLVLSAILTFAIAVTWSTPLPYIFWINSAGVLIQLLALLYFLFIIKALIPELRSLMGKKALTLFVISLLSFILKIIIQTCVVIPHIATVSYTIRNFVIGFIHLLMLGCISLFMIAVFQYSVKGLSKISLGLKIFIIGIVSSEILLFIQGIFLWSALGFFEYYYEVIFFISILMPLGLLMYLLDIRKLGSKVTNA